jgi:hypothetical protein
MAWVLLHFDQDEKLKTTINIPNMLFDMTGEAAFSVQGFKTAPVFGDKVK